MCNVPPKFYQLCRLCLSIDKENVLSIFDKAASERNIPRKIMTCLSILVSSDDKLPHMICLQCTEQLEALHKFKEVAKRTEHLLQQFLVYTKDLRGTEEEKMRHSENLLSNLTGSLPIEPQDLKLEPTELPCSINPETMPEPQYKMELVSEETPTSFRSDLNSLIMLPLPQSVRETVNAPLNEPLREPYGDLEYSREPLRPSFAEPVRDSFAEPMRESFTEPVRECFSEPVAEPFAEPVRESFTEPVRDPLREPVSDPINGPIREPIIKVKPPSALQYPVGEGPPNIPSLPTGLNQSVTNIFKRETELDGRLSPTEPADLSNKKPENLTCMPELEYIKEEADNVSIYSNSSDPERLEVDMSQAIEDHSNSSTCSGTSPTSETIQNHNEPPNSNLWQALSHNGYNPSSHLSGEASQLLRKLITCRKLGMSITPTPPHVLNYTLFQEQQRSMQTPSMSIEKSSARRKQSFPTKANVQVEGAPMEQDKDEDEYIPDFTGNSPWCNLVKGKGGASIGRRVDLTCTNCGTQTTTIWRRNLRGEMVCNACGLYFKLHGIDRPVTMRRDTIHTRRRRPKTLEKVKMLRECSFGSEKSVKDFSPFGNTPVNTYKGSPIKGPKEKGHNTEAADTEDMLSALRRQIQPHLVMALQGHNPNMSNYPQLQSPHLTNFLPTVESPSGSAREAESDEDSIADLPLNLVSTQMTEAELH